MASIVFMRGVNVGGHKRFQPSVLAREMADFDVVSIGAAGTFLVRRPIRQAALRAKIMRRLSFDAELMICRARDIVELVRRDPFAAAQLRRGVRAFVAVLAKPPRSVPKLPLCQPAGDHWQVQIIAIQGRFALCLWRKMGRAVLYPNEVVEKRLGIRATTRGWNTITAIGQLLGKQ
jgi:uncharacterized protein (DUF1697 family)